MAALPEGNREQISSSSNMADSAGLTPGAQNPNGGRTEPIGISGDEPARGENLPLIPDSPPKEEPVASTESTGDGEFEQGLHTSTAQPIKFSPFLGSVPLADIARMARTMTLVNNLHY